MSDSKPHSDRSDFDLVRAGLKEAPPHDHDHLAWNALERIEEQYEALREALRVIGYDGPNPGLTRSPELRWAADVARAALRADEYPAKEPAS